MKNACIRINFSPSCEEHEGHNAGFSSSVGINCKLKLGLYKLSLGLYKLRLRLYKLRLSLQIFPTEKAFVPGSRSISLQHRMLFFRRRPDMR